MLQKTLKYGIMGGTFDPIHVGHLVIAEEVRHKFNLDKVIFVPSGEPPHKDVKKIADAKHRYLMTLIATMTNSKFRVSSIEIDRKGKTYTIDTLKTLKGKYKEAVEFYFITGADAIVALDSWKQPKELLELCKFIAVSRPGFNSNDMDKKIKELENKYDKTIHTVIVPALEISSTDIRDRIKRNMSVKYQIPEAVEHYIIKNNLYK